MMTDEKGLENTRAIETPYFLIDENELSNNVNNLEKALNRYWDNYIIGYSFKTNSLPWLVDYFKKIGFYAEVVSDDEYQLAHVIGYDRQKIVYNGPAKSKETFLEAIKNGCIVNIDSQRELHWLKDLENPTEQEYEVGIRVNFDLERYCPNESAMGAEGGRFGFCYENGELQKAIEFIASLSHVTLTGIHLHCSTKTRSLNIYRAISIVACEIKQRFGLVLKYVDIGGGFFGGLKGKPEFEDYLAVISKELNNQFSKNKTVLIVEPGTSLVSSPLSLITSVIDVKSTCRNNFVVTDGSRNDIDPLRRKTGYFYNIDSKTKKDEEILKTQVISGFTCMEDDRIFILENHRQLSLGDVITYEKVGAYTMSLSPLFIKYFPAVYVKKEDKINLIREKWTAGDYVNKSIL